ncbi:hypothetical protein LSH36_973g00072 [Paralvinella palmiformis]|uniref:Uncharacterized protein n=1 Tax=Paralvinella palmiformis TaxID=53620 RepID=A0AAD9IX55_9ANNE|nr:hypothetical protein LSH36_973g00072 [Paralvinella palmiformis]
MMSSLHLLPIPHAYFMFVWSFLTSYGLIHDGMPADEALHVLTSDFWSWKLREFPELATTEGIHDYDDKLESYSYSNFDLRLAYCKELLAELDIVNKTSLSRENRLTYDVLKDQLNTFIHGYEWKE